MKAWFNIITMLLCGCLLAQTQKPIDSLVERANELIYENPDQAIALGLEVLEAQEVDLRTEVNVLLLISTAYTSKRDYVGAQQYILRIEKLLPIIKDKKLEMNILNRIGAQYQDLKIYDKSIEYLDMSAALMEHYPVKDSIQHLIGYNATIRGFSYREQMNCDIAIKYFDKAIEAYSKTKENHLRHANSSVCYYNKGNCLLALERTDEAQQSFEQSILHAKDIQAKSLIAFAQKGLAEVKTVKGEYADSNSVLLEALQLSTGVGDLVLNKGIYSGLANNYLALNQWEQYQLYHEKFVNLQNETKVLERKTINQSLLNLTQTKAKEIQEQQDFYGPIKIVLAILCVLCLILFFIFIKKSEKKLKQLKGQLKGDV